MFQLFHMQCHQRKITSVLHCNCNNVIYLIACKNCLEQYIGSATNIKNRFRVRKSDINDSNIFQFLSVQIIEQVYGNATDIAEILWHRRNYWQSQLFTATHGMNSLRYLCCYKRKEYRK